MPRIRYAKAYAGIPHDYVTVVIDAWGFEGKGTININHRDEYIQLTKNDAQGLILALETAVLNFDSQMEIVKEQSKRAMERIEALTKTPIATQEDKV